MRHFYSEKEQQPFTSLGYNYLMNLMNIPPDAYNIVAMNSFTKNLNGKQIDSIRRCICALQAGTPYRLTKEFDDLIELE